MTNLGVGVGSAVGELCGLQAARASAASVTIEVAMAVVLAGLFMSSFYDCLLSERENPPVFRPRDFSSTTQRNEFLMGLQPVQELGEPAWLERLASLALLVQLQVLQSLRRELQWLRLPLCEVQS